MLQILSEIRLKSRVKIKEENFKHFNFVENFHISLFKIFNKKVIIKNTC